VTQSTDREATGNHRWHSLTKIGAESEGFCGLEERLGCGRIARTRRCLTSWRKRRTPRAAIFAHLDAGGAGLEQNVREAIERLRSAQAEANT
jgi:hypothetical protein